MKLQNLLTCRDKAESHLGFYSAFPDIGNYFPISGIGIPDIGKSISDIGKWSIFRYREMIFGYRKLIFRYREMCLISRYRDTRKSPPDRSRSLRHPATPPYHTAPYQQRPPAIPVPSACGLIRAHLYDFSKSISATNNNHTTDDFAKKCTWEICGAELMTCP